MTVDRGLVKNRLILAVKNQLSKNFHFWEKYWIFLASIYTGIMIGFGLSGYDITSTHPVTALIWAGLFVFDHIFGKGVK